MELMHADFELCIWGGNDLRRMILVLLAFFALVGAIAAEDYGPLYREEKNMSFNMDQKVSGSGFFSIYRYALMPDLIGSEGRLYNGVEAKNKASGSGNIDIESEFSGQNTYTNESNFDAESEDLEPFKGAHEIEVTDEYEEETTAFINSKESAEMTYAPTAMVVGSRYYALHPVTFSSLLDEETSIKNRNGNNSMSHRVEGAHGLSKHLEAESDLTDTSMNIEEDLIDGRVSLKAIQFARNPQDELDFEIPGTATREWKQPLIVFEQDYAGTYHIKNNMTMLTPNDGVTYADAWLPCCSEGYLSMPPNYQMGNYGFGSNVRGLFDCTCLQGSQVCRI